MAIVIVALLAATPLAVWEFMETGELYVLSRRFGSDLAARLWGPGRIRFIFQPAAAIILGARDGAKDARAGVPPFLSALIFRGTFRTSLWRSAVASVRDLVAIAILLDLVSQFLIFRMIHPGAALLLGPLLIAIPYALSRATVNRVSGWRERHPAAAQVR